VAYTPDWEPLAVALKRVIAAGASEDEAKLNLCGAVADQKIRVRVRIAKSDRGRGGQVFFGGNVGVPPHLASSDFDWKLSRPFAQWQIGPMLAEHYLWIGGWENRPIDLIELSTADVIDVLISGASVQRVQTVDQTAMVAVAAEGVSEPSADPEKRGAQTRERLKQRRGRREVDRAAKALKVLYPNDDIPAQDSVPNKALLKRVNETLANMTPPLDLVKMDTVLRATNRRK
jgi:hypothetical protein